MKTLSEFCRIKLVFWIQDPPEQDRSDTGLLAIGKHLLQREPHFRAMDRLSVETAETKEQRGNHKHSVTRKCRYQN
jgi:hypothetical protein